jgi:low affinity Fe/Cu permease
MKQRKTKRNTSAGEDIVNGITRWVGSSTSLVLHTIFFAGCFALVLLGFELETVLLTLTTVVSLEAIYLALFIQMTVNRASESLEAVEEDIAEIEEDVQEIHEDVAEIEKDIDEIQVDLDEMEKEEEEQKQRDVQDAASLRLIEDRLAAILSDLEKLRR